MVASKELYATDGASGTNVCLTHQQVMAAVDSQRPSQRQQCAQNQEVTKTINQNMPSLRRVQKIAKNSASVMYYAKFGAYCEDADDSFAS